MTIDFSGLDEFQRKVEEIAKPRKVSVEELFNSGFMEKHTMYSSLDEMLQSADVNIESQEDWNALGDNETWNRFIVQETRFTDWQEMMKSATAEYYKDQLGLKD